MGYLGLRGFYRFAGIPPRLVPTGPKEPRGHLHRRGPFRFSRLKFGEYSLKHAEGVQSTKGTRMKRKSGKPIVDLDREPAVVHFNVGSGYVSYLEPGAPGEAPRVKRVRLPREPS